MMLTLSSGETSTRDHAADLAMDRYANGDDGAFESIYDALAPRISCFLRRHVKDPVVAEDLLQQTFLQMVSGRGTFLRGARVTPWAFAIARRLTIDAARKDRRQVPVVPEDDTGVPPIASAEASADRMVQAREAAARVEAELARMPEAQRVAFELTRLDGLSMAEAAEVLRTTPNAVKLRVFRAYEALRGALGDVLDKEWAP